MLERSYRERLRLQPFDAAYIESAMAFGKNSAQIILSQWHWPSFMEG